MPKAIGVHLNCTFFSSFFLLLSCYSVVVVVVVENTCVSAINRLTLHQICFTTDLLRIQTYIEIYNYVGEYSDGHVNKNTCKN